MSSKNIKEVIKEAKRLNKQNHYFVEFCEDLALKLSNRQNSGKLSGIAITVKDNICIQNVQSRAGSAILKGYKPVKHATVIEKIISAGGIPIGKTSQDEFGFGSLSINMGVGFKTPKNPNDPKRVCGGSSGGAAGFTAKTKHNSIALAESTGGSIAAPASYCGVVGFTPTYGVVSRYGLIDYANSLDKIGTIGKTVEDAFRLFSVIKGKDSYDATSTAIKVNNKPIKKVGIIKEFLPKDEKLKNIIMKQVENYDYDMISLPFTFKYGIPTYYIIAMAESSTNLAKYCGLRYGLQLPLDKDFRTYFSKVRSKGFGKEAKRRILLGTFTRMSGYREAYYIKALQLRQLIIKEYKKLFKNYDVLVSPVTLGIAPTFKEAKDLTPLEMYQQDLLTVGPNVAGLPHISIPAGHYKNMPYGCLFIANHFDDNTLSNF